MERHSLLFRIKPGTEAHVADVLAGYESPATVIDDETRLLRTTVFMHGDVVVRTMDIEGSLQKVAAHLSRQPQIQATEQALNSSLAEPRDLSDPAAAGAFFRRAMMQRIVDRRIPVEATRRRRRARPGCRAPRSFAMATPSCACSRSPATSARRSGTSCGLPRCEAPAAGWRSSLTGASSSRARTGCAASFTAS
jgi:hypothetical protein